MVFFEPDSPFFSITLKVGGATLAGFILCGTIFEIYRRKVRKNVKTGKFIPSLLSKAWEARWPNG